MVVLEAVSGGDVECGRLDGRRYGKEHGNVR